jgi:ABC-type multidrug transport system ATPase subunit
MNPSVPSIKFNSGLAIGYKAPLGVFEETVNLEGGTHFLIARNGRGKSTLLRTIAGSLKSLSGDFETEGFTQYLPEDMRFDPEITVRAIFKSLISKDSRSAAFELAERIELDLTKPYGKLSTGNRRKTALIMAEFSIDKEKSNILLLDEPFSGLDAFARETFEDIWKRSSENVLRLVSCHPDYESMKMPSVLMIESNTISHHSGSDQKWSVLKNMLN